jgi:hypothetical protein
MARALLLASSLSLAFATYVLIAGGSLRVVAAGIVISVGLLGLAFEEHLNWHKREEGAR